MPRPVEAISTPQGVDLLAPPRRCVFRSRAKNYLALADSGLKKVGEGGLQTQHKFGTNIPATYPTFMEGG